MSCAAKESRKRTAGPAWHPCARSPSRAQGGLFAAAIVNVLGAVREVPPLSRLELQSLFGKLIGDAQHPCQVAAGADFHNVAELRARHRDARGNHAERACMIRPYATIPSPRVPVAVGGVIDALNLLWLAAGLLERPESLRLNALSYTPRAGPGATGYAPCCTPAGMNSG